VLTGGALLFRARGPPVVPFALSIASFPSGGFLGGFSLGMLWPPPNQRAAILGMGIGILAMTFVVFARPFSAWFPAAAGTLEPLTRIAWPWYVLIGTTITMATGILSSFTHPEPEAVSAPARERAA